LIAHTKANQDQAVCGPSASGDLTCEVLTSEAAWERLRDDWQRLYNLTPGVTPWQHWDFLSNWWRCMAKGRPLRLCVVAAGHIPQLIMPLQISVVRTLGMAVRVLEPVGMPDDINRPRLALGLQDESLYHRAFDALWESRHEWDALRIDEKLTGDWEAQRLREFADRRGLRLRESPFHPCPYLDLRQSWPAFLVSRSSRMRKNLRTASRRLEARGRVEVRRYTAPGDIEAAFDVLLHVHSRSWKTAARIALAQGEAYRTFYRAFVRAAAERGEANAWVLSCNDAAVAATVAFHDGATYYSAQIVHDEAYAECSPGTLLEAHELQALMEEGQFATYDFLGAALSNKLRWTSTVRVTQRLYLARPGVFNALVDAYYFRLKPRLKHWMRPNDP
jgi:CelD/BcsL family acetyltransferase involved in cellulose biosynthesis